MSLIIFFFFFYLNKNIRSDATNWPNKNHYSALSTNVWLYTRVDVFCVLDTRDGYMYPFYIFKGQ
jgi:hypothetical protein